MPTEAELKQSIRARVGKLAAALGRNASAIADQDELSLENFGSIDRMAEFLSNRKAG